MDGTPTTTSTMTPDQAAAAAGCTLDDALVLQGAHVSLLLAAAAGRVDLNALARQELAARGVDGDGKWVGFPAAAAIHLGA